MKFTHSLKLLAAGALMSVALTACHDDDDELNITLNLAQTQISYDSDGVWEGLDKNSPFASQYMIFSHTGEIGDWGLVWNGFTPARIASTEVQENWLDHQFQIMTGGGMAGKGTPYIVGYWNTQETADTPLAERSCRIFYSDSETGTHYKFHPQSVYVTNTAYAYYTMLDGSAWSKKFGADDYFTLVAHGVKEDGSEVTTEYRLARPGADGACEIADSWELFSLSGLGEVTDLYFTMESSDSGQWGMNTPSYFALDCLSIRAVLPGK